MASLASSTSKTYKGVTYYQDFTEARSIRDSIPGSRIVRYLRGWAVQIRISGPYYCAK